jgi:2-hydroxychromene-2-carboxylate isomerase
MLRAMTRSFEFWFDYSCPYAYLGSETVEALAQRCGAEFTWRPFLLGGVFRAVGTPQKLSSTLSPAKAAHNAADLLRWAELEGVPLRMPEGHPLRTVEALRATLLTGCDPKVIHGFFRAYWEHGEPISSEPTLRRVLADAGHDPEALLPRLSEAKEELVRRTDEALARGVFGAPAYVVDGELHWGQDRAHFVEARLTGRTVPLPGTPREASPPSSPRTLEVFFDFSSPFAYLGASQVAALASRTGASVVWRPLLLGGLFRSIGQADVPLFTFSEAKQRFVARDLDRWAAHWGVPFRFPSRFPTSSVKALRAYLSLPEPQRGAFRDAVFRAYWAEDRDIADDAVLRELAGDPLAAADAPELKQALRAATEEAAARGVFGVPTFVVEGELFWGQDRLGLVERALAR